MGLSTASEAEDDVIRALVAAGFSGRRIALGLRRSKFWTLKRIKALGLKAEAQREHVDDLPAERWAIVPGWRIEASTEGRFRGPSGRLLKLQTQGARPKIMLTDCKEGVQRTAKVDAGAAIWWAFRELVDPFALPGRVNRDMADLRLANLTPPAAPRAFSYDFEWTAEDDAALRRAPTRLDAFETSRHTEHHTRKRIKALGLKWPKNPHSRKAGSGPARGSVPYFDPLWSAAHAVVPRGIPEHVREDLISDMVLLRLEGHAAEWRELAKLAVTNRNRLVGAFKERSIDAPLSAGSDLRLIDVLADDCHRY